MIPEWVYLFLRQRSLRDAAMKHFRGAVGQQRVPDNFLLAHSIPLPSLDEQRRIVARIEALFDRIAEARRLRGIARQDLQIMLSSALEEVLDDPRARGWRLGTMIDVVEGRLQYGTSQKASAQGAGLPVLRMGNVVEGQVSFENLKCVALSPAEEAKYLLREGDILFNRTNSAELVGKSAVYPGGRRAVFASYLIRLRVDRRLASPYFVCSYINSRRGRQYIQSRLVRAIGQANVNARKLLEMPILIPPLAEQHRLVDYLDGVRAHVAELKHLQAASAAELDRLSGAVLAQAFRGEL